MSLAQDVDAIIAEENIDNTNLANEEPQGDDSTNDATNDDSTKDNAGGDDASEDTKQTDDEAATDKTTADDDTDSGADDTKPADNDADDKGSDTDKPTPELDGKTPTETVEEAQTLLSTLELTEDKIFDDRGEVRPFGEVVPAGAYLAAQLSPVKVTDKDGKEHEFLLLTDVEKLFPNGFEAKNNIEQMKFERAILSNEAKFEEAVKTYKAAEGRYTQETNAIVQARSDNDRLRGEYNKMAEQGLVPKVEGDPNDPKFLESAAVKELDKILNWMDSKNKELREQGLGQINSLYVAKQLMDIEGKKIDTNDKKEEIINERKEVASLSASGSQSGKDDSKPTTADVPLNRLADEIIAQEGLK